MQTRRKFLAALSSLGLAGFGSYAYATRYAPGNPVVERITLPIHGLPERAAGFRIAHLSDFHWDSFEPRQALDRAIDAIHDTKPHLICLTGDFISNAADAAEPVFSAVARTNPRHGVFACMGNHDIWHAPRTLPALARSHGIELLQNRGVALPNGLYVAGTDSCWLGKPDLAAALSRCKQDQPAILLAHEPDVFVNYARDSRLRLQLSGHTHGGQVRLPILGALKLPIYGRKFDAGHFQQGTAHLYVNRGLGCIAINVRILCPPELTLLTLVPA